MNIISATQQFQAAEKRLSVSSRHEISLTAPTAANTTNAAQTPSPAGANLPLANSSLENTAGTESKTSDTENEDARLFNALTTIGTVKRILEQLKSGELLSWIDGNGWQKIQAQAAERSAKTELPGPVDQPAQNAAAAPANRSVIELHYRYQQVDASFAGTLTLADGSQTAFSFAFSLQESYLSLKASTPVPLTDPLVLSVSGQPFQWTGQHQAFDLNTDGKADKLPLLSASQYYLAFDRNNDNQINDGRELFGPQTANGFAELSALDDNGNGFVESNDSAWQQLRLWRPGEVALTLQQVGVAALSTQSVATAFGLYDGDALLARIERSGIFLNEQGQAGLLQQVDLKV